VSRLNITWVLWTKGCTRAETGKVAADVMFRSWPRS